MVLSLGSAAAGSDSAVTLLPPISAVADEISSGLSQSDKVPVRQADSRADCEPIDPLCPPLPVLDGGWGFLLPPLSAVAGEPIDPLC